MTDALTPLLNETYIADASDQLHYRRYKERDPMVGLSGRVQRQNELLWLNSAGQPPSQCESLHHLFRVVFDAIGVSVHMPVAEREIVHRDMRWFNVLCKPKHNPKTFAKCSTIDHRSCIDCILPEKDLQDCGPRALVTGLDHSAVIETIESAGRAPRNERTGTPLFVALELSDRTPRLLGWRISELHSLLKRFKRLESTYPTAFSRAFPDGNTEFLRCLSKVIQQETETCDLDRDAYTNPTEPNRLHHDAEGVWWAMMWALVRAAPMDENGRYFETDGFDSDYLYNYSDFCRALLNHRPGAEKDRAPCITNPKSDVIRHLHSLLKTPAKVVIEIATYLSVPWHLYVDRGDETRTVCRDHAHQAMRRLLLLAILEQQEDAIYFDPNAPRTFDFLPDQDRAVSTTSSDPGMIAPAPAPATANIDPRSGVKRSHSDASNAEAINEGSEDPKDGGYQVESENKTHKRVRLTAVKDEYEVPGRPTLDSLSNWIDKLHIDTVESFAIGH